MGDNRRFDLFAKLAERHVPKSAKIVDVAGGKGHLQAALRQRGYKNVTSWDKRKRTASNRQGHRYGYFSHAVGEQYEAVLAMHPDEATDHAILYAAKHRCIALVCPCCVKWSATPYWGPRKYPHWIKHLKQLASKGRLDVQETALKMNGKNLVLICTPKKG